MDRAVIADPDVDDLHSLYGTGAYSVKGSTTGGCDANPTRVQHRSTSGPIRSDLQMQVGIEQAR